MARTGLPGKRKGFRAYLYTELEAHHVVFLKVFFSFLQLLGIAILLCGSSECSNSPKK